MTKIASSNAVTLTRADWIAGEVYVYGCYIYGTLDQAIAHGGEFRKAVEWEIRHHLKGGN